MGGVKGGAESGLRKNSSESATKLHQRMTLLLLGFERKCELERMILVCLRFLVNPYYSRSLEKSLLSYHDFTMGSVSST
jgi:hypothetical protein